MDKQKLQAAFDAYSKTRDLKALTETLKDLILYMAKKAKLGYDVQFLNDLPFVVEFLNSVDLSQDNTQP